MAFASIDEIHKHYADAVKRAGADFAVIGELKAQESQAVADFRLAVVAERERTIWLREALREFPLAQEFKDQVAGDDESAIRESAKQLHERLTRLFNEHLKQRRREELVAAQLATEENEDGTELQQS